MPVLPIGELRQGSMRSCEIVGRDILLCHTHEGVFALDNICTHAYARLSEGYLRGTRVLCPLHGGAFDIASGCALASPAVHKLATFPTRIVGDTIEVAVGPRSD